jgi:hypothetical protein
MGPKLLHFGEAYDPDTLKIVGRAFEAAWREVGRHEAPAEAENRRTCLALIILALAREGNRDVSHMKEIAVRYMDRKELPPAKATRR